MTYEIEVAIKVGGIIVTVSIMQSNPLNGSPDKRSIQLMVQVQDRPIV